MKTKKSSAENAAITVHRLDFKGVNAYLLSCSEQFFLIDTGGDMLLGERTDRKALLIQYLNTHQVTKENLRMVILTHGDYDHTFYAAFLQKAYGAKIAIHTDERIYLESTALDVHLQSLHFRGFMRFASFCMRPFIRKGTAEALSAFQSLTPDVLLTDGMRLDAYGLPAVILHTPGHTKGSIAILTDDAALFCGDTLTSKDKPGQNAWNFPQMEQSIAKIHAANPKTIYPGHGEPFGYSR